MTRAFTLIEMLIAMLILSIIGTAMVGTLMVATQMFEMGERRRASADEAMMVLQILEADLANATPPSSGGRVEASVLSNGNVNLTFGIAMPDRTQLANYTQAQVTWFVSGTDLTRRVTYFRPNTTVTTVVEQVLFSGCHYFGAKLTGTSDDLLYNNLHDAPVAGSYWMTMEDLVTAQNNLDSWPRPSSTFDSANYGYPSAVRVVLMIDAGRVTRTGRVIDDDGGTQLRIAGIRELPTTPGSFIRVGAELIGYHRFDASSGSLSVNDTPSHGPLNSTGTGRGLFHSQTSTHLRGAEVHAGAIYSMVRTFNR